MESGHPVSQFLFLCLNNADSSFLLVPILYVSVPFSFCIRAGKLWALNAFLQAFIIDVASFQCFVLSTLVRQGVERHLL